MNNPTDDLWRLDSAESKNFKANQQSLQDVMVIYDQLFALSDRIAPLLQNVMIKYIEDPMAMAILMNLYQLMRQDLVKGMLNFGKGYVTDSSFQTRRILESAALYVELVKKPNKAKFYANLNDRKAIDQYVDNFKVFNLVKKNLSPDSLRSYENLCLSVHPSAIAVGDRTAYEGNHHSIKFFEFQLESEVPKLKLHAFVFLRTVFSAHRDLGIPFHDKPLFNREKWFEAVNTFDNSWKKASAELINSGHFPDIVRQFQDWDKRDRDGTKSNRNRLHVR